MTKKEFLKKYHDYTTEDMEEAEREATKVNAEGIEGDKAVVRVFLGVCCLMLESASNFLKDEVGI